MVPTLPFFFAKHSIRVIFSTGSYVFFYVPNMYSHNPQHNPLSVLATLIPHRLPITSSAPMKMVYNPGGFYSARRTEKYASGRFTGGRTRYTNAERVNIISVVQRNPFNPHIVGIVFSRGKRLWYLNNMHTQDLIRKEKYGVRSDTFFSRLT